MSIKARTVVERNGATYSQVWAITETGRRIFVSEERVKRVWEEEPDKYFPVRCKTCGQTWGFPMYFREELVETGFGNWECSYCKRGIGAR